MIDKKEIINNEENGNLAAMSDQKVWKQKWPRCKFKNRDCPKEIKRIRDRKCRL